MSTLAEHGGPAFPVPFERWDYKSGGSPDGMSLRDWLAGQASGAVIITCARDSIPDGLTREEWFAIRSYAVADAMLEVRKQ